MQTEEKGGALRELLDDDCEPEHDDTNLTLLCFLPQLLRDAAHELR